MPNLVKLVSNNSFTTEADVETHAILLLKKMGYDVTQRKCKDSLLNKHWPSKTKKAKSPGFPDVLLYLPTSTRPVCIWENKAATEKATDALAEAQFYIEGLRTALPNEPALPRIAAGFNGHELYISFFNNESKWVSIKSNGIDVVNEFPTSKFIQNGINSQGLFTASNGSASIQDLRSLFPKLKTIYRNIPVLASGRQPIDFTVALLTLKLLVEQHPEWGTWDEQPRFASGAKSYDHKIGERFETIANRIMSDVALKQRYGDIFNFHEKSDTFELSFSFVATLQNIEKGRTSFKDMFALLDSLPPLTGADFDIFGEVYQSIGDEATKKKLGEFFTGRHIISAVLPVLLHRSGINTFESISNKKIADIACGTGGFLTEMLRLVRRTFAITEKQTKTFAQKAFYGYDMGHANASRARVNMYFAGDGFSTMEGGFDSLSNDSLPLFPKPGFDIILTNPPYGQSSYGRSEDAFLRRVINLLKKGSGWGCIVLPTGVIENPRSSADRFNLLCNARVTDVIALPMHAFAPYTKQRTAVLIFNKRPKPIEVPPNDWGVLISQIGTEEISMYLVDNDGYANSDKRYPTTRLNPKTKAWLHNDLAGFLDASGRWNEGFLFNSLVRKCKPANTEDEFGNPVGKKYGVFSVASLLDNERGVVLLPDMPLRGHKPMIPYSDWCARVDSLLASVKKIGHATSASIRPELTELTNHPVELIGVSKTTSRNVAELFNISKGNQGLTEVVIYEYHDKKNGVPVYGGGAQAPTWYVSKSIVCLNGNPATIFKGPSIVVCMDGSSGNMHVIGDKEEFVCNHHGCVLEPKKPQINAHFFVQQATHGLKQLASNKDGSATLTKSHLECFSIEVPDDPKVISEIGKRRKLLQNLLRIVE